MMHPSIMIHSINIYALILWQPLLSVFKQCTAHRAYLESGTCYEGKARGNEWEREWEIEGFLVRLSEKDSEAWHLNWKQSVDKKGTMPRAGRRAFRGEGAASARLNMMV